jgi:hypothetical protein
MTPEDLAALYDRHARELFGFCARRVVPDGPRAGRTGIDRTQLVRPTPAYLAALPTDPDQLLALLREQFGPLAGDWSVDHAVFDQTRGLLYNEDPLLTPAVRGALYEALALLPGVGSSGEVTYQGERYVTIWFTERGERDSELLLDPATGHVAGEGPVERAVLWHRAAVRRPGDIG